MAKTIPRIVLNNGHMIPALGLGTWKSKPAIVGKAVEIALDMGYRHIDCAFIYENEKEIGNVITNKLKLKEFSREQLFVTSKLWNTYHRPNCVENAIRKTLEDLQLQYLDLYLIHWPMAYEEGEELIPVDGRGRIKYSGVHYLHTWHAMETLVEKQLTKSIGVSNFNKRQIDDILNNCSIAPVINQVECHPYLNQSKLMRYCKFKNIIITCYSPLGSPDRPWAKINEPILLKDPKLLPLAKKYGKSEAQIVLRYQIQRGNVVIPKSVTLNRIRQNMLIFDFELDNDDMDSLNEMHVGTRYIDLKRDRGNSMYPFTEKDPY